MPSYLRSLKQTKKRFCFPSYTSSSQNPRHKFETCHNETCTNHRCPRTRPRHNQNCFEMVSGENRKQWHKYLTIAILNYNTTYHSSIDCKTSPEFHSTVPHNILNHKPGLRFIPNIAPATDFAEELLRRTKILYDRNKKIIMRSYIKFRRYYDKKPQAAPLKEKDYCFIFQPKAHHQGLKTPFRDFRWIGPYLVEEVLANSNYIVRKFNNNKTQNRHRIRL